MLRGFGAPTRLPEAGVVVERDLAVEGEDLPLRRTHERVHLDQYGVLAEQYLPEPDEYVDGRRGKPGRFRDLGRLRGGDTLGRVDGDTRHGFRAGGGHLLDLHAAFRGGDGEEAAGRAVEYVGDVELCLDVDGFGQHHLADRVSLDVHAEDLARREFGGGGVRGELHTTRLAAATGLDLRLHYDAAAEPAGDDARLLGRVGDLGPRHQDAVVREEFPCLVFVQVHLGSCLPCLSGSDPRAPEKCRTPPGHHPPDAG
ncbi:hypothetical protein SAV14893_009550 [Streptomyces avermitilis]|uniref:Uncharacterized protein n=1 Tax=Streptomyces avermitilis TaxID=33903 RepID=A0A4D4LJP1_STRAX|nr:hypothetical protein SAV14893_009550 [Streptomyces avermitilis]